MKAALKGAMLFACGAVVGLGVAWNLLPRPNPPPLLQVEVDAGIDRLVPLAKFKATPFADVIESLRQQTHANIVVDQKSLEASGFDMATPVTLWLHDLPLRTVLREILLAVGAKTTKLAWYPEGGAIRVSTDDEASSHVIVRLYDVQDLIASSAASLREVSRRPSNNGLYGSNAAIIGNSAEGLDEEARDGLLRFLCETIEPDSWRDSGGSVGAIRYFSNRLIVTQTAANHDRLARLLDQLRGHQ